MNNENVLTKETVEQFLSDEDSVDLSEFIEIADDAAESLSKHKGTSCSNFQSCEIFGQRL